MNRFHPEEIVGRVRGSQREGFEEELFSNPSALGTFMVDDVFGPKVVQLKFWISIFSMIKIKNAYNYIITEV